MQWIKKAEATPIELRDEIRKLEKNVRADAGNLDLDLPSEDSFMDGLKSKQISELKDAKEQLNKILSEIEKYNEMSISI